MPEPMKRYTAAEIAELFTAWKACPKFLVDAADHQRVVEGLEARLAVVMDWIARRIVENDDEDGVPKAETDVYEEACDLLVDTQFASARALLDELARVREALSRAERCMCPFTSGYLEEGWKPDLKLGRDGKHKPYCPFAIAAALHHAGGK